MKTEQFIAAFTRVMAYKDICLVKIILGHFQKINC